jgi:hypothetical protein
LKGNYEAECTFSGLAALVMAEAARRCEISEPKDDGPWQGGREWKCMIPPISPQKKQNDNQFIKRFMEPTLHGLGCKL